MRVFSDPESCPLCGLPMYRHEIDLDHSQYICPNKLLKIIEEEERTRDLVEEFENQEKVFQQGNRQ